MQKKSAISSRKLAVRLIVCLAALVFALGLYWFNDHTVKTPLISTAGRSFEKATVLAVTQDNLQEDGRRYGNQQVKLQMNSGVQKGRVVEAVSPNGMLFGAVCRAGMEVITINSANGGDSVVTVYSRDREKVVLGFVLLFLLLLSVIGGKRGLYSALGLIFTFICIFYLMLPLIYHGFSPFFSAIAIAVMTTLATMYLIGGWTAKSFCAAGGALGGVATAGLSAWLFGFCADINGYNVNDIESLLFIEQNTRVHIGGLLFAGILISALGAVMDIAISIAASINEIYEQQPKATVMELFRSGMTIGRDIMGTMCSTLILAFTGGSLGLLVLNYSYDLPYLQLINSYHVGIEVMQGVSGAIGIIVTVPLAAMLSAWLIPRLHTR